MRTIKILALALVLGFAMTMIAANANAALAAAGSNVMALQGQQPATPQEAQPNAQEQEPTAQVFAGKIMQQNGEFVLYDATSKTTYKLDDQAKAKQFKDKDVKVQGVLDSSSNTIKVTDIQPATADE